MTELVTGKTLPNVVVTGIAMTTALATDAEATWKLLLDGQSGIRVLDDPFVEEFDLPVRIGGHLLEEFDSQLTRVELRRTGYLQRMSTVLSRRVWENAGSPEVDTNRLMVSIGTGLGSSEELVFSYDDMRARGMKAVSPLGVQKYMPNGAAAAVGLERHAKAGVMTPVSACASGSEGIAQAWRNIVFGEADIAICGGVETRIEAVPIAAFAQMRIVMSTKNDDPAGACRPFDKDRNGFVFGEAGALMVIETEEHAKARGANILARIMGASITSDGYHMVAPDPNGERAGHAMSRAIQLAGLAPSDIDHVNAHATGTSVGDLAEGKAINNALGPQRNAGGVRAQGGAGPLGGCGRCGGVDPDRARVARPGGPADTEPGKPRPRDRSWTWWRASRGRATTSTRSTTRSDSAGTTWHSPSGGTDPEQPRNRRPAMTTMAPESVGESLDPRDPLLRLSNFFDDGTVELLHERDRSGVLAAAGTVNGMRTIAFCTDGTVMGGAMGVEGCTHIVNAYDTAIEEQSPIVGIWHSGGARLAEGVRALHAVGLVFEAMIRASGYIPQVSVVVGFAAGGAAYGPALTDVVVMAPESRVFVTGPDVVRSVTGEDVDMASLGGPETHHKKSGVCHIVADDELDAYERGRRLVGLFCQQGHFDRSKAEAGDTDIHALLPESSRRAYDVHPIVTAILDDETPFDEFQANWAPSMVVGLGRLSGRTVGVLANNPLRLGGCLNSESAEKAARFVRLCDAFGIPLVVIVDVPGYLPGVDQEWGGVVRRGAKLLHAFGEATVPRVTLVTRKTYGGAYIAMNSRSLNATKVFAWPDAEVAVMGAKAAVGILHKKKLAAAPDHEREALHDELAAEHERIAGGVDSAIEIGVVDEKIDPAHTRSKLTEALAQAPARRGRHKNIPL